MSINIQAKQNFSFLFGSMGSSGGSMGNLNFLSDYASIKNGSYGRLMKTYFGQNSSKEVSSAVSQKDTFKNPTMSRAAAKNLAEVQSTTDNLKESADALLEKGSKSVFSEGALTDKTYNAVSKFVDDYNSVISATDKATTTSITNKTLSLTNATESNKKLLEKVGITINDDNTLSLDKDAFMKADFGTVKNLFNTTGSYGYRVSSQASMINYTADNEAAKANTYNFKGSYSNSFNTGNIFNSYF